MPDIRVDNQGTVVALAVLTDVAREWFDAHVVTEPWQWLGHTVGVAPRLALRLLRGAHDAGLVIE